jgi:hypothetical protein
MPNPEDDYVEDPFADDADDVDGAVSPEDDAIEDPFADDVGDSAPDLVEETQTELGGLGDFGAGALDGLLLNYGGEFGEIGENIGNVLSGAPWDAEGVNPFDDAQQTSMGSAGNLLGNVAGGTALGLATGGVGGIAAQAGIQGGIGAVQGFGANHDPYEALMGGGIGALFGAGGRALAGKFAPAANQLDDVLPRAHEAATEYAPVIVPGELQSAAGEFAEKAVKPPPPVWAEAGAAAVHGLDPKEAAKEAAWLAKATLKPNEVSWLEKYGGKMLDMAAGNPLRRPDRWLLAQAGKRLLPNGKMGTMAKPDPAVVKNIMANVGGASALTGQRLQARPDLPTLVWGLQSVNASGDTGLPQQAQEKLDQALASGDDSNVSSVYMSLSMAYPAFQKRMQREIESINDEGE